MTTPCIITVAITGSVPTKKDSPAVPITVAEQIESTHAAYEAGAALVHAHAPAALRERAGRGQPGKARSDDFSATLDHSAMLRHRAMKGSPCREARVMMAATN